MSTQKKLAIKTKKTERKKQRWKGKKKYFCERKNFPWNAATLKVWIINFPTPHEIFSWKYEKENEKEEKVRENEKEREKMRKNVTLWHLSGTNISPHAVNSYFFPDFTPNSRWNKFILKGNMRCHYMRHYGRCQHK